LRGRRWPPGWLPALIALSLLAGCAKARPVPPSSASNSATASAVPGITPALATLREDLAAIITATGGDQASWGVLVQSLRSDERLFEHHESRLLVPGSTLKLITAAAAAAAVGWDYRFTTTAETSGPVEAGVLQGDLVLRGSGDPSLHGRGGVDLVGALAAALRERGISRIAGRLIGDDSLVEEARPGLAWSWDDLGTRTGTLAGALNLDENVMRLTVRPGAAVGAAALVTPPDDATDTALIMRALTTAPGSRTSVWAEQRPGDAALTIAGTVAADARPVPLVAAVGNPTLWFARAVRARLVAQGIAVTGPAVDADDLPSVPAAGTPLLRLPSRTLAELTRPMLKESINLYAEALLRLATGPAGARTTDAALDAEREQLEQWQIATQAIRLADGSGLSRWDLVSAETLVAILRREQATASFVEALPVAGVDGTLADRMTGTAAAGNARAKTGSMTHVRSLAGYVTTRDGETVAFAVIVNNAGAPGASVSEAIDRVVVRLAEFRR